jgi:hypothetical protein
MIEILFIFSLRSSLIHRIISYINLAVQILLENNIRLDHIKNSFTTIKKIAPCRIQLDNDIQSYWFIW